MGKGASAARDERWDGAQLRAWGGVVGDCQADEGREERGEKRRGRGRGSERARERERAKSRESERAREGEKQRGRERARRSESERD
eukprot:2511487-Pleurochrysis_carterae.AAC.2